MLPRSSSKGRTGWWEYLVLGAIAFLLATIIWHPVDDNARAQPGSARGHPSPSGARPVESARSTPLPGVPQVATGAHPAAAAEEGEDGPPLGVPSVVATPPGVARLAAALKAKLCSKQGEGPHTPDGTFKCPSRRHAYGAAWLATRELFEKVDFKFDTPVVQLEMASHDMFATASRGLKTACYEGFFVEHLSAYGKHVKMGGDSEDAKTVAAISQRAEAAMDESCSARERAAGGKPRDDVAVLIPFYTGDVVSQVVGKGAHSFGGSTIRLQYVTATLCSVAQYFSGDVVFGVCATTDDAALLKRYFDQAPYALPRYRVVELECGAINNNLPSKTLAMGQELFRKGELDAPYVFFTESDHVVWWRSLPFLEETLQQLDGSTYYTPYRLEESYLPRGGKRFGARVKDTTGPVVALEAGKAVWVFGNIGEAPPVIWSLVAPPRHRSLSSEGTEASIFTLRDTSALVETLRCGRDYTITNQCQHPRFPHAPAKPARARVPARVGMSSSFPGMAMAPLSCRGSHEHRLWQLHMKQKQNLRAESNTL